VRLKLGVVLAAVLAVSVAIPAPAGAMRQTFPGLNGKMVFAQGGDIWTVNPDGTGQTNLTASPETEFGPAPAPDGAHIAFFRTAPGGRDVIVTNDIGSTETPIIHFAGSDAFNLAYSPNGSQLAVLFSDRVVVLDLNTLTVARTFNAPSKPRAGPPAFNGMDWSPDGSRVAISESLTIDEFTGAIEPGELWNASMATGAVSTLCPNCARPPENPLDIWSPSGVAWSHDSSLVWYLDNIDLGQLLAVTPGGGLSRWVRDVESPGQISPDRRTFAVGKSGYMHTLSLVPQGAPVQVTQPPGRDVEVQWSPDGTRLEVLRCYGSANCAGAGTTWELFTIGIDGMGKFTLVGPQSTFVSLRRWLPFINSYPRPKAASPIDVSLVPAYATCGSPNRQHGGALSFGSCANPQQTSGQLTVGTPDANGRAANSTGSVRLTVVNDNTGTPADEADVTVRVNVTAVKLRSDLSDYGGEVRLQALVRATDKLNQPSPTPSGLGAATVSDVEFGPSVPCLPVPDPVIGSACFLSTSVNALIPGLVVGGARSIWEFGQVRLYDGGPDRDGDTAGDNTLFMTQGVFVP
jgi:WD40 repeat protein